MTPSIEPAPVLVTGGAGFIGAWLVRLLLERGHCVRVLDLEPSPSLDARARFLRGTILDAARVAEAVDGCRWVFHLAANPQLWAADKRSFLEVNYHGTRTVLDAAGRAGAERIVFTSTESILKGKRSGDAGPANEDVARRLEDMPGPYCRSKFLAEQFAFEQARRGLPVVVVNPTLPVGPGDHRLTPPTRMLLDFLNGAHRAYLDFQTNFVDVRDAAAAHIRAAEHGMPGRRYILAGQNVRLSQVLGLLGEISGLPMPRLRVPYAVALAWAAVSETLADHVTHRPPRASMAGVRVAGARMSFDSGRAARELGFRTRALRSSLADAVAWLWEQGLITRTPLTGGPRQQVAP